MLGNLTRISTRPSKTYLFYKLAGIIKGRTGIGIDAASSEMKMAKLFGTEKYIGMDIDGDLLRKGISSSSVENLGKDVIGICCDISKIDEKLIGENFADVVVSTNTLNYLSPETRVTAIKSLSVFVKAEGMLVIQVATDELDEIDRMLRDIFLEVHVVYYRNIFSRWYEELFSEIADSRIAQSWVVKRLFVLPLAFLETLTSNWEFLNSGVLLIAKNKRLSTQNGTLNLSKLSQKDGIYYYPLI